MAVEVVELVGRPRCERPGPLLTFDLDVADVYRALTYYYDHPEEMREVERKRVQAIEDHEHLTTDPDSVRE